MKFVSCGLAHCPDCDKLWNDNDDCDDCGNSRSSAEEPYFSWTPCEECLSSLGGDRYPVSGIIQGEVVMIFVCVDCYHEVAGV